MKFLVVLSNIFGKALVLKTLKSFSHFTRWLSFKAHKIQMDFEWNVAPEPEWFDHYLDQYFQYRDQANPLWMERGIFGLLAMKQGSRVLELCCGDGYNAYHFYSGRAKEILAVDFDPSAISHAKQHNPANNINFQVRDIRFNFPEGNYENILWDAAIEHFTEVEIDQIMKSIKAALAPGGIVSGYTIVEKATGEKSLSHHEYEFKSKEDLMRFFLPYFKNVKVFETVYPTRHNLYFYASDSTLPFDNDWSGQCQNHEKSSEAYTKTSQHSFASNP